MQFCQSYAYVENDCGLDHANDQYSQHEPNIEKQIASTGVRAAEAVLDWRAVDGPVAVFGNFVYDIDLATVPDIFVLSLC